MAEGKRKGRRILICGGRDYTNGAKVRALLDAILAQNGITLLVTGGARGADMLAFAWANEHKVEQRIFPVSWDRIGQGDHDARNLAMIREVMPDFVLAFPGGMGTRHMVDLAVKLGIPVVHAGSAYEGKADQPLEGQPAKHPAKFAPISVEPSLVRRAS